MWFLLFYFQLLTGCEQRNIERTKMQFKKRKKSAVGILGRKTTFRYEFTGLYCPTLIAIASPGSPRSFANEKLIDNAERERERGAWTNILSFHVLKLSNENKYIGRTTSLIFSIDISIVTIFSVQIENARGMFSFFFFFLPRSRRRQENPRIV